MLHTEQTLVELDGLVHALIFIGENADDAQLPQVRAPAMTLLYVMADRLRAAERRMGEENAT